METLDFATDIQPVTKFRANTCEMIESLKKNHRIIILTQHGWPVAVLESVEEYQRKLEELRFMKGLVAGLRDIESGRVVEGEEFFQGLKSRIADSK